jgi:hypothetical protein
MLITSPRSTQPIPHRMGCFVLSLLRHRLNQPIKRPKLDQTAMSAANDGVPVILPLNRHKSGWHIFRQRLTGDGESMTT